jgi:hypothetical protein
LRSIIKFCTLLLLLLHFRTHIEGSYGHEIDQLRKQYTQKDNELIQNFFEARRGSLKSETTSQILSTDSKVLKEDSFGNF